MLGKSPVFLVLPAAVCCIVFLLIPVLLVIAISFLDIDSTTGRFIFTVSVGSYAKLFASPTYMAVLADTLTLAGITVAITLVLGYPLAYYTAITVKSFRIKTLMLLMMMILFFIDMSVRVIGWYPILGNRGLINYGLMALGVISEPLGFFMFNRYTIILLWTQGYILFMAFPIYLSLLKLDPSMIDAAEALGANRLKSFYHITFKMSLPGVMIGLIFVLVMSATDYATPVLMGGGVMTVGLLIEFFQAFLYWPLAAALATVTMVILAVLIFLLLKMVDVKRMVF